MDEPASPTGVMLSAAMEIMEGMASLRQAALGYKASLIEDGWNEADKIANQDGGVSDEDISFTDGVYASASAVSDRADRLAIKETRHD